MTREEMDRIDALRADIADWRDRDREALAEAIAEHEAACLATHLEPYERKLDALVQAAHDRVVEERQRKRWFKILAIACGSLATAIGVATPFIMLLMTE
ncbi:hypothetical protein [Zavarzinia sp.]|uniref:hypothetical protein n=1 Tax=Zavarzinia sp. TaxID=2027920 RepID=UPI003563B019